MTKGSSGCKLVFALVSCWSSSWNSSYIICYNLKVAGHVDFPKGIYSPTFTPRGVKLPNTLIFDYPTVSAISAFAAAQVGATTAQGAGLAGAEMAGRSMPEQMGR